MSFNTNARYHEVQSVKRSILESARKPTELLVEMFKFCEGEFDVTGVQGKLPELYQILKEFCETPPVTHDELKLKAKPVAKYFNEHKDSVRRVDVQLYYAMLNFIDMLKQKHIYQSMLV